MPAAHDLLVAYDDTDAGRRAVEFAADRAALTGESVDVVHAGTEHTATQLREELGSIFDERQVPVQFSVIEIGGSDEKNVSISATLGELIEDNDYALVVMGNEGRGLFHQLSEGSVTDAVIETGLVPVTLVP